MFSDRALHKYVNEAFTEELVRNYENYILEALKKRREAYPSEQSDREWLEFTDYVLTRRRRHTFP